MQNCAQNNISSILSNESAIATVLLPQTSLGYSVVIDPFFYLYISSFMKLLCHFMIHAFLIKVESSTH